MAAAMVLALGLVLAGGAVFGEETGYWGKFKGMFVDWDDDAPPGSAKTTTAGVRGLDKQKKLGGKEYDWKAVNDMEDYKVTREEVEAFLKEGQLGPFQAKGK
jgi:hypothetical protein